jgi:Major capsid protein V20 C-terminal domain/Sputnik virophage major capsid protein 1st domain
MASFAEPTQTFDDIFRPNLVSIQDPIITVQPRKYFPVIKGGVETTLRNFTTTTFGNTSLHFNVPPPNPTTFVSRRFLLHVPITAVFSFAAGTERQIYNGRFTPRQLPLHNAMKTIELIINGQSVSQNMNDINHPLMTYHDKSDLNEREFSLSPNMRDYYNLYQNNFVNGYSDPTSVRTRSPLRWYDLSVPGECTRGTHPWTFQTTLTDASTSASVLMEFTEEIMLSPLLFSGMQDEGFIGVQNIDIDITWDPNLAAKMFNWVISDTVTSITGMEVTIRQPKMLFRYVSPPITFVMPPFVQYSYSEIQRYLLDFTVEGSSTSTALVPNTFTVISQNIQLNSIPRYLYVFVRRNPNSSEYNSETPDSYCAINTISLNWNNSSGLLSSATQEQLYDMSRKNGSVLSWPEWSGKPLQFYSPGSYVNGALYDYSVKGIGSVLCLEFGTDIGLREDEAPGIIGTYNLQITVNGSDTWQLTSGQSFDSQLVLLTVTPGAFTIYNNSASKRIGILSRTDVLSAPSRPGFNYDLLHKNLMAGGFKFKNFVKKMAPKALKFAARTAKNIAKNTEFAPIASAAYNMAYKHGMGAAGGRRRRKKRRRTHKRSKSKGMGKGGRRRKRMKKSKKNCGSSMVAGKKRRKKKRKKKAS